MGYPSLPIMTVEELYQQRRETGEWGPPPTTSSSGGGVAQINQVNEQNQEDEEDDKMKELLEEKDDEMEIARKEEIMMSIKMIIGEVGEIDLIGVKSFFYCCII